LIAIGLIYLSRGIEGIANKNLHLSLRQGARRHLFSLVAALLLLFAISNYLELPNLLFTSHSPVAGATYADIHARLPLIWVKVVTALIAMVAAICCSFGLKTRLLWAALA